MSPGREGGVISGQGRWDVAGGLRKILRGRVFVHVGARRVGARRVGARRVGARRVGS